MKLTLAATLFAAALSLGAAAARATENATAAGAGASSVADMLQRKHATDLRAQFVKEGRWDEVRKLDEVTVQRQQDRRDQRYTHVNEELARSASVDGPLVDTHILECDPDTTHVR